MEVIRRFGAGVRGKISGRSLEIAGALPASLVCEGVSKRARMQPQAQCRLAR